MLKNKKIRILVVLVFAFSIVAFCFFKPNSILNDWDNAEIVWLRVYPDTNQERFWFKHMSQEADDSSGVAKLSNVDETFEQEVLHYLSTCRERRTLERENSGHLIADVEMEIALSNGDGKMKTIYLGTYNYSYTHLNGLKSEILHPEEVKAALLKLAKLTP